MPSTEPDKQTVPIEQSIHVVAAVIYHAKNTNCILISKRPHAAHQGGLWEFPGGKVEPAENSQQALHRELMEELGIEVIKSQPLMQIHHNYSDKQIFLEMWTVTSFRGRGQGMEGQECRWVTLEDLLSPTTRYQFPLANGPVLEKLRSLHNKSS